MFANIYKKLVISFPKITLLFLDLKNTIKYKKENCKFVPRKLNFKKAYVFRKAQTRKRRLLYY